MSGNLRFNLVEMTSEQGAHIAAVFVEVAGILERIAWNQNLHWDDRHAARDAANGLRYLLEPPEQEIVRFSRRSYEREVSDD